MIIGWLTLVLGGPAVAADGPVAMVEAANAAWKRCRTEFEGGQPEASVASCTEAHRLYADALPNDHARVRELRDALVAILDGLGRPDDANAFLREALADDEAELGPESPFLVDDLVALALRVAVGDPLAAGPLLQKALDLDASRPDGLDVEARIQIRFQLGRIALDEGRYPEAESQHRIALQRVEDANLDVRWRWLARWGLGTVLERLGRLEASEELLRGAVADAALVGPAEWATALGGLGATLGRQARLDEAETTFRRALALAEEAHGTDSPALVDAWTNLGVLLLMTGARDEALALTTKAHEVAVAAFGPDAPKTLRAAEDLADALELHGTYDRALALRRHALSASEARRGPNHPTTVRRLNDLAGLLGRLGRYAEQEPLQLRAVAIAEATLGEDHPILARRLANLAAIRIDRGDYPAAEPPLRRALAISERSLGPDHLDLAPTLTLLAHLLEWTGRYTEAEPVYRRALAIQRAALGPRHADVGFATDDLAVFLTREWRLDEAADLHQQAITILEEALGPDHPKLEHPLANLGLLAVNRGQLTKAEPLAARALAIATRAHGPDHPKLASSLNDLAYVHDLQGRYAEAEAGYRASIALVESAFGTDHESAVSSLVNLAMMNVRAEHSDKAVGLLADAADREERALLRTLGFGTARQRERRLAQFGMTTGMAVSLHLRERPDDDAAAALALQTVLRRKGRLEALEMQLLDPAGRSEEGSELREALASVTTRLDLERTRARPDAERIEQLTGELDRIQSALAAASGAYAEASRTVALEEVAAALPAHTALLELVVYRPFDARRAMFGADHYAAYVLRPDGSVRGVALGPADPIDREVRSVREAIVRQRSVSKAARRLSSATLGRLGDALRDVTHLYVAPDGPLALVPLEVLGSIGPTVSYLTSGRELLRAPEAAPVGAAPWVIYDVDYDRADRPFPEAGPAPRVRWDDLPGAEAEGAVVARKLRGAHTLTGPAATETALRQLPTPRVLHVASHGFIDAAGDLGPGTTRGLVHGRRKPAFRRTVTRHPMLGSGVVLAGANRPPAGDDNGQLTAAELSGLDLHGTQLVVLSACHTGEGELRNGDGVHGLRRGLVLAGSRTQVLSLWAVPDEATAVLMRALYQALARGATVADALKKAQAAVARRPGWAHPWYWAAFTVSGDPEVRLRR